jgi:hypothetical protein
MEGMACRNIFDIERFFEFNTLSVLEGFGIGKL